MSLRAMRWAWKLPLPPAPKLLAMALADEADDRGYSFPSQRRLAMKCSVSDRTVRRLLVELERKGYVSVEHRHRPDGSPTSNGYRLACGHPPDKMSGGGDKMSGGADTDVRGTRTTMSGGADTRVRLPTTYPSIDPLPLQRQGATSAATGSDTPDHASGGGDFAFPKTLTKGQMEALLGVLSGVGKTIGQQVLDELAGRLNVGQVDNPIRYCTALVERAKRGQFSPELGIRMGEARAARVEAVEREKARATVVAATGQKLIECVPESIRARLEALRRHATESSSGVRIKSQSDAARAVDAQQDGGEA